MIDSAKGMCVKGGGARQHTFKIILIIFKGTLNIVKKNIFVTIKLQLF